MRPVHKAEAGGVILGIEEDNAAADGFNRILKNLYEYKAGARFEGVRVTKMAGQGHDMFIGGRQDPSFGPVVFFGLGGIYIEIFRDIKILTCPADRDEVIDKACALRSFKILTGARGGKAGDTDAYVDMVVRVSHLMARFPEIMELDINPVRILADGTGAVALDARVRITA
jgi:acyl-CoA synthetase (NDP forming)